MTKEQIENLFDIEKRKLSKDSDNEDGYGLGLFLCKQMLEKNKSQIHIESEKGLGTKISFELPIK